MSTSAYLATDGVKRLIFHFNRQRIPSATLDAPCIAASRVPDAISARAPLLTPASLSITSFFLVYEGVASLQAMYIYVDIVQLFSSLQTTPLFLYLVWFSSVFI